MEIRIDASMKSTKHVVIQLFGRLDGQASEKFEKLINELIENEPVGYSITLDMGDVSYISSLGIRLIMTTNRKISANQGQLVLANMQKPVKHVIEIAKVLPTWSLFASVEEADRYFDTMQKQAEE